MSSRPESFKGPASINGAKALIVKWDEREQLGCALHKKKNGKPEDPRDLSDIAGYEHRIVECILTKLGFQSHWKNRSVRRKKEIQKLKDYVEMYFKKQAYLPKGAEKIWRLSLSHDISNRLETNPVKAFCDLDHVSADVTFTQKFQYINQNRFKDEDEEEKSDNIVHKCNCAGECKPGSCNCIDLQNYVNGDHHVEYLPDGRVMLDRPVMDVYSYLIVMCGDRCGCPKTCPNRLKNLKLKNTFEIFRRNMDMGFGVRTMSSMRLGELVFEFVGRVMKDKDLQLKPLDGEEDLRRMDYAFEIFNREEYNTLQGRTMTYTMKSISQSTWKNNFDDSQNLFIDPYTVGNVSRYLSCSCYPNLATIRVVSNYLHPMRHHIFMIAMASIAAGSELTFDYGEAYRSRKGFECLCGAPICQNGPLKDCKSIVPLNVAVEQLVRLQRAWKKESEARDEYVGTIELDSDDEDFWKTHPKPVVRNDPPHIWNRAHHLFKNPVQDADWDPSKFVDRRRTDLDVFVGDKREHVRESYEPHKRSRIDISPEREHGSVNDVNNIPEREIVPRNDVARGRIRPENDPFNDDILYED